MLRFSGNPSVPPPQWSGGSSSSLTGGYSADQSEGGGSYFQRLPPCAALSGSTSSRSAGTNNKKKKKSISFSDDPIHKRRKVNEQLYDATRVEQDLARAGEPFHKVKEGALSKDLGCGVTIQLKGVKLVHSSKSEAVTASLPSFSGSIGSTVEYEHMLMESFASYRSLSRLRGDMGPVSVHQLLQDAVPGEGSITSSVSDGGSTTTDSEQSNLGKAPVMIIPPLLDTILENQEQRDGSINDSSRSKTPRNHRLGASHIISTHLNSVTMSDMMALSDNSRLIVESVAPFKLVFYNASFARMVSLRTSDSVRGKPFDELLARNEHRFPVNLSDLAVSSSNGSHQRVRFQLGPAFEHRCADCCIKVMPIVDRKTKASQVTKVLYLGIEVVSIQGSQGSLLSDTYEGMSQAMDNSLAVGVMG